MACDIYTSLIAGKHFILYKHGPFFIAPLSSGNKTLSTDDYYVGGPSPVLEIPLMVILAKSLELQL